MKKILVTGGLGYIGSHVVVELLTSGFEVVIIDDLSNSSLVVLDGIFDITSIKPIFEKIDLKEKHLVIDFFKKYNDIDGIIHFAASKAVGESVNDPLKYYENNINSLLFILKALQCFKAPKFVFSSSCTVYGQADELPITENTPIKKAESPYGNTKIIGEEIIKDLCSCNDSFSAIALRYFNPIGAHSSRDLTTRWGYFPSLAASSLFFSRRNWSIAAFKSQGCSIFDLDLLSIAYITSPNRIQSQKPF